jgi:ABC-type branched-subunit amino acid transport system permease subunit
MTQAAVDLAPPMPLGEGIRRRLTGAEVAGLAGLGAIALLPIPFGSFGFFVGQFALVYAILGLSVVVVTGYAGLVSLMTYSFAGIGAMVTGIAMASWGWPFWLAIPLAALATVPVSIVVGVTAVRLKGLYLAIATLTLADALGETFFKWSRVTGGQTGWVVQRPKPFVSDASYYVLLFVVAMALVWMVTGLRSSRIGRAMLAVRSNEREAQALGINIYKTKLIAFLISGMLGGVGGGFLALLLKQVTRSAFQSPLVEATSILLVTVVVVGGIDRALGAFLGAVALVVQQQVFQGARFFFAYFGIYSAALLVLFLLYRPGGLMQVVRLQWRLIRARPRVGITVAASIIAINVGVAWLFVRLG